ncbi:DUF5330 domain-containing protein [Labrenzia sp. OB1]|uniref:DUF5330 domain-containing protein n=1 Tax=Labrenzia sp. OB1 TaxID=1561204 RepID=UPI000A8E249C|nr:DUF5330 domain-containing protein [Labrenzia sp. OB1]
MARKIDKTTGSDMFFLLRTAFWLTLVLVLIPFGSDRENTTPTETVDPVSAFLVAQATVSDIGGFCGRNPQACETGGNALTVIGSRARDGVRIVYEYIDTRIEDRTENDALVTGSTSAPLPETTYEVPSASALLQPVSDTASSSETEFGPVPRSKPHSGRET